MGDGDAGTGREAPGGQVNGRDDGSGDATPGEAVYVFGVTVRIQPEPRGVWAEPDTFGTTVYRSADPPGEDGWLFFRDNLWRGELAAAAGFNAIVEDALGVPVESVDFRELRTDEAHLSALRGAIGDDLALFNAESTTEVLSKYLGSSIRVTDGRDD